MTDPHSNEYLAAAQYLAEQTPHPGRTVIHDGRLLDTWMVGDSVKFLEHGHQLLGTVVQRLDARTYRIRRYVPDIGVQYHVADVEQIVPF